AIQYLRDNSSQQSAKPVILEATQWLSSTLETTHLSKAQKPVILEATKWLSSALETTHLSKA
ncbi:hypothetical protein AB4540_18625, partial [Vibrio breoganii]